ncbi:MAG: AmpG family muropeptide MFS transporter [Sandaracinaceae bacterium]|nr:AmpG family muropeptide MFS transporter [Sandaracinaceae bacterium]
MAKPASFWDAFRDPKLALMLGLGFASGLPNPLAGDTLSAWFDDVGVPLASVAFFGGLVHLPYNLKFVWASVFDRFWPPFLSRRRSWLLVCQVALLVLIGALGALDPSKGPALVAGLALVVAFTAASQDIVADAYRTELLSAEQRASGVAIFVMAYRVALIVTGSLALIVADHVSWTVAFGMLAALMSVGVVTTLIAPPVAVPPRTPRTMREAIVEPFRELLGREQVWLLLFITMLYKFGDVFVTAIRTPFLREVGFTLTEIGSIVKLIGLIATIVGALLGGGLVAKWGLKRAMIVFGVAQAVPNLSYAALAVVGKSYSLLAVGIGVDNLAGGMGTAALTAFFMTICNRRFTAMQYALLTSLMTVPGRLLGMGSGWLTEHIGWPALWVASVVAAIPALVLLVYVRIVEPDHGEAAA